VGLSQTRGTVPVKCVLIVRTICGVIALLAVQETAKTDTISRMRKIVVAIILALAPIALLSQGGGEVQMLSVTGEGAKYWPRWPQMS